MTTITKTTKVYDLVFSDKTEGSLYRNTEAGLNLPVDITVKHQRYVDSKTKRPGRRTVVRIDKMIEMSDGTIAPVSAFIVAMIPEDVNVTTSVVNDVLDISNNLHSGHTGFDNIRDSVFLNGGQ